MANVKWTGLAAAVAQVDTFTPGGTIEADDIFILTVTGWDGTSTTIQAAAGGTTATDVVTALKTAWNASPHALCTPITASGTATLILTADTAGVPFSVAASTTEAGGGAADAQTFERAATTASAGALHWDSANNWSGGAVPGGAASQDVFIEDASGDILYGLDQSGIANTLSSLTLAKSFTGRIGVAGAAGFAGTSLKIKASAVTIGSHAGTGSPSGSGRIMIDTGSTASAITVAATASTSADTNKPACRILADSASTTVAVLGGSVGVAFDPGETATVGTITARTGAAVYLGAGLTLTTLTNGGGTVVQGCAATTVTNDLGTLTTVGSGAITTLTVKGGTAQPTSSGTITALNVLGGLADFSTSPAARTVTTAKVGIGGRLKYDPAIITMTNKVQPYETSGNVTLQAA